MDLFLRYIKDKGAVVHIWDYLKDRPDRAMCGHAYLDPLDLDERRKPPRLCRHCRDLMPRAEAIRYRQAAEESAQYADELAAEYDTLGHEYEALWDNYQNLWIDYQRCREHSEHQREQLAHLQRHRPTPKKALSPRIEAPPKKKRTKRKKTGTVINPGKRPPSGRPRVALWTGRT